MLLQERDFVFQEDVQSAVEGDVQENATEFVLLLCLESVENYAQQATKRFAQENVFWEESTTQSAGSQPVKL